MLDLELVCIAILPGKARCKRFVGIPKDQRGSDSHLNCSSLPNWCYTFPLMSRCWEMKTKNIVDLSHVELGIVNTCLVSPVTHFFSLIQYPSIKNYISSPYVSSKYVHKSSSTCKTVRKRKKKENPKEFLLASNILWTKHNICLEENKNIGFDLILGLIWLIQLKQRLVAKMVKTILTKN